MATKKLIFLTIIAFVAIVSFISGFICACIRSWQVAVWFLMISNALTAVEVILIHIDWCEHKDLEPNSKQLKIKGQ